MTLQHDVPAVPEDAPLAAPEDHERPAAGRPWLLWLQSAALLLALVVWARVVTARAGGRDPGSIVIGPLSLLPALVLVRPARRDLWPLALLVLAALLTCMLAPFGFAKAGVIGVAAYSAAAFAVVRAFAATAERRIVVADVLCLVSLDQFAQGFLAWWGGRDPHKEMIGTFFWHNQYAAFLLPGVIIGAALAVFATRQHRWIGFVTAPVCLAGIVYSTSRATMMLAVGGLVVVAAVAVAGGDRRRTLPAVVGLGALAVGTLFFFTSPVFFPHAGNPFGATEQRAATGETLSSNTGYRLDFWKAALGELGDRPVVGGGFGSFGELSGNHLPVAAVRTVSAHNELLQAFAEGGLLWGLPVLLAVGGLSVGALRRSAGRLRAVATERAVAVGATVTVAALLLHALVDFDWTYPSLVVSLAAAGGLAMALPLGERPEVGRHGRPSWLATGLAGLAVVLGAQVVHAQEAITAALRTNDTVLIDHGPGTAAEAMLAERSWYPDPRIDARLIDLGLARGIGAPLSLPTALMAQAAHNSTDYASVDDDVNARRAVVLYELGDRQQALAAVHRMALSREHHRASSLQPYARLLALDGQAVQAADLLGGTVVRRAPEAKTNGVLGLQLLQLYDQLARLAPQSPQLRCAGAALTAAAVEQEAGEPVLAGTRGGEGCDSLRTKGWT